MSRRVLFDTNFLSWLFSDQSPMPFVADDPNDSLSSRMMHLLDTLDDDDTEIVIPSPVIAEALCSSHVIIEQGLQIIRNQAMFRIIPFGQRMAEEYAHLFKNNNRTGNRNAFKFDLLILATAKIENVDIIYSCDDGLREHGRMIGLTVTSAQELPKPRLPAQGTLSLTPPPNTPLH